MKYCILVVLFLTSCNNKQNYTQKKLNDIDLVTLNTVDKINIDSVLSVIVHGQCVCTGTTGLGGNRTEEFKAYELMNEAMTDEQLFALLRNKSPKIRLAAIDILHSRENAKLFKEGAKLLANDTSLVCDASGCLVTELPLSEHVEILNRYKNRHK